MHVVTPSDVARFIDVTKRNLFTLAENLVDLGYRFADTESPIQLADVIDIERVQEIEANEGQLPTLYAAWYRTFRRVNFCQATEQLSLPNSHALAGLGLNCPLVFLDLNTCLELRKDLTQAGVRTMVSARRIIPTGGSASNCAPKGVWIPDGAIDPILYDEGAVPMTMAWEVSTAFAAGGFPFWDHLFRRRRFKSPIANTPSFREILPALMRNLTLY